MSCVFGSNYISVMHFLCQNGRPTLVRPHVRGALMIPGGGSGLSVLQVSCQVLSHQFFLLTLSYVWNGGLYSEAKKNVLLPMKMVEGSSDISISD